MAFFARAYLLLPSLVQDASVRSITTLALVVSTEKASRSLSLTMRRHTISCQYHIETLPTATSEPPFVYPSRWGCTTRPLRRSGRCSGPLSCSTGSLGFGVEGSSELADWSVRFSGRPAQINSGYIDTPMPRSTRSSGSHVQLSLMYERLTKGESQAVLQY